jgi:hypothetical protein
VDAVQVTAVEAGDVLAGFEQRETA